MMGCVHGSQLKIRLTASCVLEPMAVIRISAGTNPITSGESRNGLSAQAVDSRDICAPINSDFLEAVVTSEESLLRATAPVLNASCSIYR